MASYRFCRPDDIPLLVDAVNRCYCSHFENGSHEGRPWDNDFFHQLMNEQNIWPGWCAIAMHDSLPIGVVVGAKRYDEKTRCGSIQINKITTHPQFLRQGHSSHILNSLIQKLRILAPGIEMTATVEAKNHQANAFFKSQNFEMDCVYNNYILEADTDNEPTTSELCQSVNMSDVKEQIQWGENLEWSRSQRSIWQSEDSLFGVAVPSVSGYLAYFLYRKGDYSQAPLEIMNFGCSDLSRTEIFYALLLKHLRAQYRDCSITLPNLHEGEMNGALLKSLGFKGAGEVCRYRLGI